jgi:pimeloyl-ACP methyl ester carboxylesterase
MHYAYNLYPILGVAMASGNGGSQAGGGEAMKAVELSAGTVRYRDVGSGPPILFVHGLLANGLLWRKVTPLLTDRARCIVPDWPLGGHSPAMRPDADVSPPAVAALIGEFIDKLGLESPTLVGNDTGGALVQMLLANRPDVAGKVVLTPCDSFENYLPPMFRGLQLASRVPGGLPALAAPLRIRALRGLPMAFGWLTKRGFPGEISDGMLGPYFADRGVRRDTRKFVRGISRKDTIAAAQKLPGFSGPALVVWAREDKVFPVDHGKRLAELLNGAPLELVDDSYSFVPEDQPERLAQLIGEFVLDAEPAVSAGT